MNLRIVLVAIALVLSAMLLGTGVYQNVVDAPNYIGAPASLEHARGSIMRRTQGCSSELSSPRHAIVPAAGVSE
jgi:hypothetical protein